jgi:hypothetical protein
MDKASSLDENYIRQHAAAIAQALLDQDERPKNNNPDAAWDLYEALCFDNPMLDESSIQACPKLSRALLSQDYGLSNRFVHGVLTWQSQNDHPAVATLTYNVLLRIPLECLLLLQQASTTIDLEKLQKYLGSYKDVEREELNKDPELESQLKQELLQQQELEIQAMTSSSTQQKDIDEQEIIKVNDNKHDNNEEVWATELDPSDFDFGDGAAETNIHHNDLDNDYFLDPLQLSQPDPTLSNDAIKLAIASLLQQATYTTVAPMLMQNKSEIVIQQLTQLVLLLLTMPATTDDSSTRSIDRELQNLGLTPLWILRDAALQQSIYVDSYLEVLQTLLAVDVAHQEDHGGADDRLHSATIVGIQSLAAWCQMSRSSSSNTTNPKATLQCMVDCMNDLAHAMRKITDNPTHSQNTLIPILESLSGIDEHGKHIYKSKHNNTMPSGLAQVLLSSGVLGLVLDLALQETHLSQAFRWALFWLCQTRPTVVGRYAWRYPGVAHSMTTTAAGTSSIPLTQIVWNALGATLMDPVPTSTTVVWKTKNSTTHPPPSLYACQEAVGLGFQTLCQSVVQDLVSATSKEASFGSPSLDELEILVHSLVSSSALCASTVPLIQGHAPPLLEDIRQALANLPKPPETTIAETTKSDSDDDDDDNDGHEEKKRKSPRNLAASRTQKVLKQFTLLLQAATTFTSSNVTSKTD